VGGFLEVNETVNKIRRICARLIDAPPDSARAAGYRSELKAAAAQLAAQQNDWNVASEGDKHQDIARQSYRSRESDSADGFAEGLKLFNPKKRDSDKEKS
jgi:hypothetical protein